MSGRWMVTAVVFVGLAAATVGCVPVDKYNQAVAAASRANEQLRKSQSTLQVTQTENQQLRGDLAGRDGALAVKDKIIANLELANAGQKNQFDELYKKYMKLAGRDPIVVGPDIRILPIGMDAALRALAKENPNLMDYMPKYGMVKLKADLTFNKGSATVKPGATAALEKLAEIVSTDEAKNFHVYAAGHTDDIPLVRRETIDAHGSNWGLSLHRAGAVIKVLAVAGVQQPRLGAMGFSKYHPVAPNEPGNRGNPLNRRVEIWIVPPDRLLTASSVVQPEK